MSVRGDDLDTLARGMDVPACGGTIGTAASDFVVHELAPPPPPGNGWLWLDLERCGWNTADLAATLAAKVGIATRDVTVFGRKDRHACVRQWFVLRGVSVPPPLPDGVQLHTVLHGGGPARLGGHDGNAFVLRLYGIQDTAAAELGLAVLATDGFPNYFGAQRFAGGDNAARGAALLRNDSAAGRHSKARLWLNAWQAARFNEVLDAWLRAGRPQDPDDLVWHAAAGQALPRGTRQGPPTGPLFGAKQDWPRGVAGTRERAILAAAGWPDAHAFQERAQVLRLWGARRPLWQQPQALAHTWNGTELHLQVTLAPGTYATALVRELTGNWQRGTPA